MYLSKIDIFTNKIKKTNPIDISNWKEFKIGGKDGIFDCKTAKQELKTIEGDFPYITRSTYNNGLTKYVKKKENKINEGNCITIGAEGFYAFYQEKPFMAGNKIYVLRHKNLNKNNGLFICSILNSIVNKYSYNNARILDKIKNEKHLFPANGNDIDWNYMENYVKNITLYKNLNRLIQVYEDIINEKRIDISNWKNIKLIDLFDYKRGKRYKKRDHEKGNIPYISSSAKENGIDNYVNPPDYMTIYENCITIANSGSIGTCFYHNYKFVASDHVHVLSLKNITLKKEIAIFLITLIEKNKNKFTFNKEISESTIKEIELFIPFKNNEPDWEYMENYVKEKYKNIEDIIK